MQCLRLDCRDVYKRQVFSGQWDGAAVAQSLCDDLKKRSCITIYNHPIWSRVRESEFIHTTGLTALEIFCAPGADPLPPERRIPNEDLLTQGNKHFSFGVPDAHKAKDEMEAMGVDIAFVAEVDGTYGVFIRDNTGNLIEIFEEGTE